VVLIKADVTGFADLIKETLLLLNGVCFYKLIYSFATCFADTFLTDCTNSSFLRLISFIFLTSIYFTNSIFIVSFYFKGFA
jgi:hypothetical protein